MKAKFFRLLHVLYLVKKTNYKLEFFNKNNIPNVFYISLLEQDISKKGYINKNTTELNADNYEKYNIKTIWDYAIYKK